MVEEVAASEGCSWGEVWGLILLDSAENAKLNISINFFPFLRPVSDSLEPKIDPRLALQLNQRVVGGVAKVEAPLAIA